MEMPVSSRLTLFPPPLWRSYVMVMKAGEINIANVVAFDRSDSNEAWS